MVERRGRIAGNRIMKTTLASAVPKNEFGIATGTAAAAISDS
jgi:hypothetical protein